MAWWIRRIPEVVDAAGLPRWGCVCSRVGEGDTIEGMGNWGYWENGNTRFYWEGNEIRKGFQVEAAAGLWALHTPIIFGVLK